VRSAILWVSALAITAGIVLLAIGLTRLYIERTT